MSFKSVFLRWAQLFAFIVTLRVLATDPPAPVITNLNVSGTMQNIRFAPYPGAQAYTFYTATNVNGPFAVNSNFQLAPYVKGYTTIIITNSSVLITNLGYEWRLTNVTAPSAFYSVGATPLSSNALLTGHVLNRLAYGPTPDDLERVTAIGPQAYINEQVNMEGIPETPGDYTLEVTNSIASDPTTNWTFISLTGTLASTTFYLFTTAPSDIYLDDLQLHPLIYTNFVTTNVVNNQEVYTTNSAFSHFDPDLLSNGDFETSLSPWTSAGGAIGSVIDGSRFHSGSSCLHLVSTTGASSSGSSYVRQVFTSSLSSTTAVALTYWYLPGANSSKLRLQLGSGLNSSPGGLPQTPTWTYVTATGTAGAINRVYFYLTNAGSCYLDDLKLVAGTTAGAGANLLLNGDFETTLTGPWQLAARYAASAISTNLAHAGSGALLVNGTSSGNPSTGAAIYQTVAGLANGQTYTLSFWFSPVTPGVYLSARLDGGGLVTSPDADQGGLNRKLHTQQASLSDYRAWFCQQAVSSPRQLFEVLSQFWENHFVTQQSKSVDYIGGLGFDSTQAGRIATDWEFREMTRWRNAMLDPQCTFSNLFKISAESPAMIAYLDTVNSKGQNNNIANENYARELLELFTFGVDNGYDQNDIILMSRAWTGWSIELVDAINANNPFAPASLTYYPNTNSTSKANKVGVLAFNYLAANHGTNRGDLFAGKSVPARFGPPWAGRNYALHIPARLTGDTNSIQDGYDVIAHLANQPFTEEYISVKLCRLFVHDDFPNPTTTLGLPEYDFYNYTDPNRSAEAELVHQCMLAWESSTPKGNLRAVLNVIFNSDLFRSHTAVAQKVKTPFEFITSSLRALRTTNVSGALTATADGYSFATPLNNMGGMLLFDRAAPDGYPENGPSWISAGSLVERIRYIQALCMTNGASGRADAGGNLVDPVGLLKTKVTSGNWGNAGAVADYFLSILYPGEGTANLALYRTAAINYLNTADDGVTPSAFSTGLSTYENRVRGMVAMLMTFHRFQEQ
jgi:uncharacterized protein (DUF1800 family)